MFDLSTSDRGAAATTAAAAVSAVAEAATAAAAAARSVFGRASFTLIVRPPTWRAVQGRDCLLAVFVAGHFDESETARASSIAVGHDAHAIDLPVALKQLSQFVFVGVEAEIPHENILHASAPALSCRNASSVRRTWQVGRAFLKSRPELATVECGEV